LHSTFRHQQHAHCESGVTANLLAHEGITISEPMAFGIGAGIFFGHLPFLKVSGVPATTFRIWPGYIFKRVAHRLNIQYKSCRFRNEEEGMNALDEVLEKGTPVGMLAGVYYLDYLPEAFRFHFNAHNLVVTGKENGLYQVSDPILEATSVISPSSLQQARYAKGFPEPNGKMYYITGVPDKVDFTEGIRSGIQQSCFFMLSPPIPWFGYKAIATLADKIENYPHKLNPRKSALYLGNIVRMQEEIGTGGGGFRFLYAAFLQEAAAYLQKEELNHLAERYTKIGDQWRNFAFESARVFKERTGFDPTAYTRISKLLKDIGGEEKEFFHDLKKVKW
jgi:hypothetical protein